MGGSTHIKEDYGWRTWPGRWLLLILLVMLAILQWLLAMTTPDQLAQQPERFPDKVGSQVILPVRHIWSVTEGEEVGFYLAQVTSPSGVHFVGIVASPDDEAVRNLLTHSDESLAEAPSLLVGEADQRPRSRELLTTLASAEGLPQAWTERIWTEYLVNRQTYLAEASRMNLIYWGVWAGIAATLIWLVLHLIQRRRFYGQLYERFPDLKGQLDLLQTDGDYANPRRGLYLYQHYLICLGPQPLLLEGSRLTALLLYPIVVAGRYGVKSTRYALMAKMTGGPAQYLMAYGRQKGLVADYQDYQATVLGQFPGVLITEEGQERN